MTGHETRQSRWPPPHTYAMAVAGRSPLRGELAEFEPEMQHANPLMPVFAAGANAVVFCGTLDGLRKGARFFTADPGHAEERYRAIHTHLESANLEAVAGFEWLDAVIEMGTNTRPCVLMDWIEGSTLDQAIADRIGQKDRMDALVDGWIALGHDLDRAQVAHGDLQHGNVMIDQAGSLRLVDLDGMWIPSLASSPPTEFGHPNYQHPGRSETVDGDVYWGPDLDAFSWLVIYVSLVALTAEPSLWKKHHTGTNLLFSRSAFTDAASAEIWNDLTPFGEALRVLRAAVDAPSVNLTLAAALTAARESRTGPGVDAERDPIPDTAPQPQPDRTSAPWWDEDDPAGWNREVQSDAGHHPAQSPEHPANDLQPDWTRPDTSWLDDDVDDDDDWLSETKPSSGRLVNLIEERSLRATKRLTLALVPVGLLAVVLLVQLIQRPIESDQIDFVLPFTIVALSAFVVLLALVVCLVRRTLRTRAGTLGTSPIVWDRNQVSIGSSGRLPYGELTVERTATGGLRFSGRGEPVTVSWLSEAQRAELIDELRRRGVRIDEVVQ